MEVSPFTIPSARLDAMGGVHAAVVGDFSTLFTNPAGFVSVDKELSVAALSLGVYGPVFDMLNSTLEYMDSDTLDFSGLIGPHGLRTGLNISGPLSFGFVGNGLGFGVFNRTYITGSTKGMSLEALASEDLLLVGGYAFRFTPKGGHDIDAGFLAKGFIRGAIPLETSVLTVDQIVNDPLDNPFQSVAGVGLDLGVRYDFARTVAAAIVCRDAYSPAIVTSYSTLNGFVDGSETDPASRYGQIDPQLDVGVSYSPRFTFLEKYVSGLIFALDYRDILDAFELIPRNPILNVGLGVELQVLDVLSLRAGVSDALPCAGFGLDLRFMQMDFTMRGIEFGYDPGYLPVFAMELDLLFRY